MLYTAYTQSELAPVAQYLMGLSGTHKVFTFTGQLGAGKTTLIKEFCKQLGVVGNVSSPTFGLVNEYETETGNLIYHFDCYRMKKPAEAYDIGFEEYLDSGHICLIEWPEMIETLLPQHYVAITISLKEMDSREVSITVV